MSERNPTKREASFGALLKYLRRRARITQAEFAVAVGYSIGQVSRLEQNQRFPDVATVAARFIPALGLDDRSALADRLLELAYAARQESTIGAELGASEIVHTAIWIPAPLPAVATPLIGRTSEIAALQQLFAQGARFVTLIGPPGVGKTRLAIAATSQIAPMLQSEAAFVDLATLRDPALVASAIGAALSIREPSSQSMWQVLITVLRNRAPILLLDTMEQLVDAAPYLADLLAACPTLRMIVTSRVPLHIRAEQTFPVEPLVLPTSNEPEAVATAPASSLFLDRAQAIGAKLSLDRNGASDIAAICARLNGLPLAIELAAARMRRFTPQQLLEQLSQQGVLQLLNTDMRDMPPRHRTLQSTIEWSYDLLSGAERTLLARLAIFDTSWTVDAVVAVCSDEQAGVPAIAGQPIEHLLGQLVEHSLVQQIRVGQLQTRFRLLEIVREFAQQHLYSTAIEQIMRQRHAMYYLALETQASTQLNYGDVEALRSIHADLDHVRDALVWALKHGQIEEAANAVISLGSFWTSRMPVAMQWLEEIMTQAEQLTPSLRASVFLQMGTHSWEVFRNPNHARELCTLSLALYREANDLHGVASAIAGLANVEMTTGQVDRQQTAAYLEESLRLRQQLNQHDGIAEILIAQGRLAGLFAEFAHAHTLVATGKAIRETLDDPLGVAVALFFEGWLAFREGKYADMLSISQQRLTLEQAMGNPQGIADCIMWQGMATFWLGDPPSALALLESALVQIRTLAEPRHLPQILDACGHAALASGNIVRARAYQDERIGLLKVFDSPRGIAWATLQLAALALYQSMPKYSPLYLIAAQRILTSPTEALGPTHLFVDPAPYQYETGLIFLIEGWATWACTIRLYQQGLRLAAAATALRKQYHAPWVFPDERGRIEHVIALAHEQLDQQVFDVDWAAGARLTLEQALAETLLLQPNDPINQGA